MPKSNGLYGVNEVPPVATDAWGKVSALVYPDGTLGMTVDIYPTTPLTLTAAYVHSGTMGTNGGVLFDISPFTVPTYITTTYQFNAQVSLDVTQTQQLLSGGMYVNVHTSDNPSGELRGQIVAGVANDGAENQSYIDEIEKIMGDGYTSLLRYQGPYIDQDGVVAIAHRDQPSLERPGISYMGRSVYTTFGLEGVNGANDRAALLGTILDWALDEPSVSISDDSGSLTDTSDVTQWKATYTSNIPGAYAVSYRWDFGDGSAFVGPFEDDFIGHTYAVCGTYTVRVEVTDNYGNVTIGSAEMPVNRCEAHIIYMPVIMH